MKKDYGSSAKQLVQAMGGKDNITRVFHCMTRLRFYVKDRSKIDEAAIKKLSEISGVNWHQDQFQVIAGNEVNELYAELVKMGIPNDDNDSSVQTSAEKKSVMIRKAILNPCTLAFIVALPFTLTGLSLLQPINVSGMEIGQIADLITYLYNICVPVSMCILGIRLADMKIKRMFVSGYMYASLGVKMVIVPAIICVGCLVLHRLFGMSGELALGMVVMAVTPTATTALAFAERFNGDTAVAGECIMSSTVVALVIVPAFLMLTASFL